MLTKNPDMPTIPSPRRLAALPFVCALAAALGGCMVGPDYRGVQSPLPASYASQDTLRTLQGAAAPAAALDTWWRAFNDPALTRIIDRALSQNLDLAAAEARVAQARAAASEAGAQYLPEFNLQGQAARQRQSLESPLGRIGSALPGYERGQSLTQLGLGASWELDLAGGLRRRAQAAGAEAEAAEALHAGSRVSVAADAADAYFQLRGLQARIAIVNAQIDANTRLVSLVRDRVANGVATQRETAEARARLAQTRAQLPPLQAGRARQSNRLDILMGAAPGTYAAELAGTEAAHAGAAYAEAAYAVPGLPADIRPDALLRRRPDVVAAERRLAAANSGIGAALAEYYPQVSLSGILGFEALNGPLFKSAAFQPGVLAGLRWRLFDFGRVDAEVGQAKGRYAETLAQYRQTVLRAAEDVENAVTTWAQIAAERDEVAHQVDAEAVAQRAARDAYAQGDASLVEVLIEDQQWLSARGEQARLNADAARAAVATFRALGGGWQAPDAAATPAVASAH
jgi:NodT family efflux transporter outer membrane factor (OMF) lipoprotein